MKKIVVSMFFVLFMLPVFAQTYTLQYNLEEGKVYNQNMNSELKVSGNAGGQQMDVKVTMKSLSTFKVLQKNKEDMLTEVNYKDLKMNVEMSTGMNMSFDSGDTTSDNPLNKILGQLLNKPFNARITNLGVVQEVTGMDKILDDIIGAMPGMGDDQKENLRQQIKQSFGGESLQNSMNQYASFPDHPVKVGDKWERKTSIKTVMPLDFNNQFELKSVDAQGYHVGGISSINMGGGESASPVNMTGSMESDLLLDAKSCWLVNGKFTLKVSGSLGSQESGKMSIVMSMEIIQ